MDHRQLRYNFFINLTKHQIHVVPEGKTGGPNAMIFGDFKLEEGDDRPYAEYEAELLEELESCLNTLPDIDATQFSVRILNWDDEVKVIAASNPVLKDPIEPEIPVPVSGEIRYEAGLTGDDGE